MSAAFSARRRALLALLLVAPVPTLGALSAMFVAPGPAGNAVFIAGKLWLVLFPAVWHLLVDRQPASWSPPDRGGLRIGLVSGAAMAVLVVVGSLIAGIQTMDPAPLRDAARQMGLASPKAFLAAAAGWTLANSLVEEYVYRWFVLSRCEQLVPGVGAAVLSSAIFTAHHVVAVSRYLDPLRVVLASGAVFAAGLVWAWLYLRFRSIWPPWLSHVVVDAAVFAAGWWLLFA